MITPIYASLLAGLFVFLSVRTLLFRRKLRIGIGTNDNEQMLRAMRVHSNFVEYAPLALLLILMIELIGGSNLIIHFTSIALLAGRALHAYGVSQTNENYSYRVAGMACTFTSICTSAVCLLYLSLLNSSI